MALIHGVTVLGGLLADPMKNFPRLFGEAAVFQSQWINKNPYALPSIINGVLLIISTILTYLFLEEVSPWHALLYCRTAQLICGKDLEHPKQTV
jgi:hypothetical protein